MLLRLDTEAHKMVKQGKMWDFLTTPSKIRRRVWNEKCRLANHLCILCIFQISDILLPFEIIVFETPVGSKIGAKLSKCDP